MLICVRRSVAISAKYAMWLAEDWHTVHEMVKETLKADDLV